MESHSSSPKLQSSLATLPPIILDDIIPYLDNNATLILFLTGNRLLASKLRLTSSLSLCWQSSSYFSWYDSESFIGLFSQLKTLRLTTWIPKLLCRERLEPDLFPSSLTSLYLNFFNSLSILSGCTGLVASLFLKLASLKELYIIQSAEISSLSSNLKCLDLTHFPSTLSILHLEAQKYSRYQFDAKWLSQLPPTLESLSLIHLRTLEPPRRGDRIVISSRLPRPVIPTSDMSFNTTSLIRLHLIISGDSAIETKYIGPQLQHLEIYNYNDILFDNLSILHPIRYYDVGYPLVHFPNLRTIGYDLGKYGFEWTHLDRFPPSLTALIAPISLAHGFPVSLINGEFEIAGEPRHAITSRLQIVREVTNLGSAPVRLLWHNIDAFPKVREFTLSQLYVPLPRHLTTLQLGVLRYSELDRLPSTLTSLTINRALWNNSDTTTSVQFPPNLQSLVATSSFDFQFVSSLPDSLEVLDVCTTNSTLTCLKSEIDGESGDFSQPPSSSSGSVRSPSSRLQRLVKLALHISSSDNDEALEISINTIPKNITQLSLRGRIRFSTALSSSLRHHASLKKLHLAKLRCHMLDELPSQLVELSCADFRIDLRDYRRALHFKSTFERLTRLKVLTINQKFPFITFSDTPTLESFSTWMHLPRNLKYVYAADFCRLPEFLWETFAIRFFASCLPRRLSIFSCPYLDPYLNPQPTKIWAILLSITPNYLILPTLKYQLPLPLGMPFNVSSYLSSQEFHPSDPQQVTTRLLINPVAPPQMSDFYAVEPLFRERTGQSTVLVPVTPRKMSKHHKHPLSRVEWSFHLLNLCTGLVLPAILPVSRSQHPWLWYYLWGSTIGSALSLPFSFYRWYRSLSIDPSIMDTVIGPKQRSYFVSFIVLSTIVPPTMFSFLSRNCFHPAVNFLLSAPMVLFTLARNVFIHTAR